MSLFLTIFEGTTPADARPVVAISDADIIAAVRRLLFERLADNVKRKVIHLQTNARGVPRTCLAGSQRAGQIVARGRSAQSKTADQTSSGFTMTVQPLVSIPVGAKILDVSVWTLRQWLSQRRLAYVKVGRLTKLRVEDIQEFINSHRQEAIRFDRERA